MAFKMKGYSYPGASPVSKKIWPPTKGKVDVDELADEGLYNKKVQEANKKLIEEFRKEYKAGRITRKKFLEAKDEISKYVDY